MTKRKASANHSAVKNFSAGIVPIFRSHGEPDLFLILRCYNYWDFPKGGVHANETPREAALRELHEETSLASVDFVWGDIHTDTPVYGQNKVARYFVGLAPKLEVTLPINPLLGRPEHHEFRWLTYDDARTLLNPRIQAVIDWARRATRSVTT